MHSDEGWGIWGLPHLPGGRAHDMAEGRHGWREHHERCDEIRVFGDCQTSGSQPTMRPMGQDGQRIQQAHFYLCGFQSLPYLLGGQAHDVAIGQDGRRDQQLLWLGWSGCATPSMWPGP